MVPIAVADFVQQLKNCVSVEKLSKKLGAGRVQNSHFSILEYRDRRIFCQDKYL